MLQLTCVAASTEQGSIAAPRCVANKRALLACIRTEGLHFSAFHFYILSSLAVRDVAATELYSFQSHQLLG